MERNTNQASINAKIMKSMFQCITNLGLKSKYKILFKNSMIYLNNNLL